MTRSKLVPTLIALIVTVIFQIPLWAQQSAPPQPETVIRSQSDLVLVDALVTGKHDKPVLDLKQDDFHVYQDGEQQPITGFSTPSESAGKSVSPRYLILFFDATTVGLAEQKFAREAAVKFVEQATQPNLYIAAEEYTGVARVMQNFTTDREMMAKAVTNFTFSQAVATLGETSTENFLFTLMDVCNSLAQVPGRKAVVLLSGGFPMSHLWQDELDAMIQAANKADVTFYPIDATGLTDVGNSANVSGGAGRGEQMSVPATVGEEVLDTMSKGTGGFTIVNSNDYLRALSKVADDLNESYTLGFVPPSSEEPGRYHRIEVKVEGRGLKVRAREGYYESRALDQLAGKPIGNELLKDATGSEPGAIPVSMSAPFFYLKSGQARVNVAVGFPARALRLEKSNGVSKYELNVLGIAFRPDGSVAKRFSEGLGGTVDQQQAKKLTEHPFDYRSSFQIAPGQYRLVVVLSAGGQDFGKSTASLDITPYDEHSLGLSGIALSDQLQPLSPLLASLKGQVLEGEGSLVAGGYQFLASPTRAFSASRMGAIYVQVYEPALLGANPPKVGILCEITNLKSHASVYQSGLMVINSQAEAGNPVIPVAFKLPMDKLSPGDYHLSIAARDSSGGSSPVREENFSIE